MSLKQQKVLDSVETRLESVREKVDDGTWDATNPRLQEECTQLLLMLDALEIARVDPQRVRRKLLMEQILAIASVEEVPES